MGSVFGRWFAPAARRELGQLAALAWPLALAQVAQLGLNTTDVMMIGWLGPEPLAAAALAMLVLSQFLLLAVGVAIAASPLCAAALAKKDVRMMRRAARQAMWAAIAVSLPLSCAYALLFEPFMRAIGQDPALAAAGQAYANGAAWSIVFSALFVVLKGFENAFEITKPTLILSLAALPANALLNYGLIFGAWGLPRLELFGAGVGTTIVSAALFVALALHASLAKPFRRLVVFGRFWRADWEMFARVLAIGLPIGLSIVVETSLFAFGGLVMGYFGAFALAGHQIALQLASITFMLPLGISQAVTIRVGRHFGKEDIEGCRRAAMLGVAITLGCMTLSALAFWTIPGVLVAPFLDGGPDAARLGAAAAAFLFVAGLFQLVDGLQVALMGALRGMQDTRWPLVLASIAYWCVGAPAIAALAFLTPLGEIGVWWGYALALMVSSALLGRRLARLTRAERAS